MCLSIILIFIVANLLELAMNNSIYGKYIWCVTIICFSYDFWKWPQCYFNYSAILIKIARFGYNWAGSTRNQVTLHLDVD